MANLKDKPTDLKKTVEYNRHNPPNNKSDFCIPLDKLITKFSENKNNHLCRYLTEVCENLRDFMSSYNKYQLSLGTQNTLVGEFFSPPILKLYSECAKLNNNLNESRRLSERSNSSIVTDQDPQDLRGELDVAHSKISTLEKKLEDMTIAMQDHLKNSVQLQVAKDSLETSYTTRSGELQDAAKAAAKSIETVYNEKCAMLEQLKDERISQAKKDDQHRVANLKIMKETLENITSNFYSNESEHIDRILKGITESRDKQDSQIQNALDKFSSIDLKLNQAVESLNSEVNNLKQQTPSAVVHLPSYASVAAINTHPAPIDLTIS
ncbi:hypothetical protein JTE90_013066 [Oedothorax gibbosus]|uniref:Uncharacterized protein n=1 Tax=Oedothorax gibbosus TaxID=931172 RepID=A0AAV6TJL1_9ARAC|nr:hypothetical protein JTE90_013066 [Oedothorax gibbosus]